MSDSELIKALENFQDNSYTIEEFVTFVNGIPRIKNFYMERANKFLEYLNKHNELIKRFVRDLTHNELYTQEENNIIRDILQNRLHLFYMLYCINKGERLVCTKNDIYRHIALDFYYDGNSSKEKLIDYIKNFCIISNNNIDSEGNITDAFKQLTSNFSARQYEMAKHIYDSELCNLSRKELAKKMHINEKGVQSLLNELKSKNIAGLKDLRTKIRNTKNR